MNTVELNLGEHVKQIRTDYTYHSASGIPLDSILSVCKSDMAHHITPPFMSVETVQSPSNNFNYNTHLYHDTVVKSRIFLITEEMFWKLQYYNEMVTDLEAREKEVRKKENEFKKLKNELKHINELSKNVNQLFKGI